MSIQNRLLSNKRLWVRLVSLAVIIGFALLKPKFDEWMAKGKTSGESVAQSSTEPGRTDASRTSSTKTSTSDPSLEDLLASVRNDAATEDRSKSNAVSTKKSAPSTSSGPASSPKQTQTNPKSSPTKSAPKGSSSGSTASKSGTSKTNPRGSNSRTSPSGSSQSGASTSSSSKSQAKEKPLGTLVLIKGTRDEFRSTAGLMYVSGSADGHRLKHVLKHASDNLSKPVHGVFDGDRTQILAWIDRTYLMGKKGEKGVRVEEERGRTVYTANLNERVGYVGGQKGKRNGHKECRYLRLVVQKGNEVVTAYPADRM